MEIRIALDPTTPCSGNGTCEVASYGAAHAFVMMATQDRPAGSMATSLAESFTLPLSER